MVLNSPKTLASLETENVHNGLRVSRVLSSI
jgi:hypothetical protein